MTADRRHLGPRRPARPVVVVLHPEPVVPPGVDAATAAIILVAEAGDLLAAVRAGTTPLTWAVAQVARDNLSAAIELIGDLGLGIFEQVG